MNGRSEKYFEFGKFRLIPSERLLLRTGERVQLSPKAFEILVVLVEHAGELITKQDLLQHVWKDSFVEEANVQVRISEIRRLLAESHDQRYIETVPRIGYRFVAELRSVAGHRENSSKNTDPLLSASSNRRSRAKFLAAIAAACALVVLTVLVIAWLGFRGEHNARTQALSLTRVTNSGRVQDSTTSANGKYVAFVTLLPDGSTSLNIRDLSADTVAELTTPRVEVWWGSNLTFSPDSKYLYYSVIARGEDSDATLFRTPSSGGEPERLLADVRYGISFAPDGDTFAYTRLAEEGRSSELMVGSVRDLLDERAAPRAIVSVKYPESIFWPRPAWSPDGKTIACSHGIRGVANTYQLVGYSPDGQSSRLLNSEKWGAISSIAWRRDSKSLVISANKTGRSKLTQLWRIDENGASSQITDNFGGYTDVSISGDDQTLAAERYVFNTNIFEAESSGGERLFFDAANFRPLTNELDSGNGTGGIDWAADGRIVYSNKGLSSVFLMDGDGQNKQRIDVDAGILPYKPRVSPDGRLLIFTADFPAEHAVFRLDMGTGSLRRVGESAVNDGAGFMNSGANIVYTSLLDGEENITTIPVAGGASTILPGGHGGISLVVSPNEQLAVFLCSRNNIYGACVLELTHPDEEAKIYATATGGKIVNDYFGWLPDSSGFLWSHEENGKVNISTVPLNGDSRYDITNFSDDQQSMWFDISPEGKRLAIVRGNRKDDVVLIKNFD